MAWMGGWRWLVAATAKAGLAAAWALGVGAAPGAAQEAGEGRVRLMEPTEEIALARTAAPPEIARAADVWVLTGAGYERAIDGTNGWSCLVEQDHPESLAPLCYDPEGARSVLPVVLEQARLRAAGASYAEAKASVLEAMERGELPMPTRPVLSLMLSPGQRLYTAPDGDPIGAWKPHVMIHFPGLDYGDMGIPEGGAAWAMINDPGLPTAYLIVPTDRWSDGTATGGR